MLEGMRGDGAGCFLFFIFVLVLFNMNFFDNDLHYLIPVS